MLVFLLLYKNTPTHGRFSFKSSSVDDITNAVWEYATLLEPLSACCHDPLRLFSGRWDFHICTSKNETQAAYEYDYTEYTYVAHGKNSRKKM